MAQLVQQEINILLAPAVNQFNFSPTQTNALLAAVELRLVLDAILPTVLTFQANGLTAMGDLNASVDLARFAAQLGQVQATLGDL